jgi:tetratricopeptide (TPR) repeat protein
MRQGLAVGEPEQPHCLRRQRRDIEQSDYVEAHSNLGVALQQQRKLDEAIAAYRQAIGIKPNYAEAHSNLWQCAQRPG